MEEVVNQICINGSEYLVSIVGWIVMAVSAVVNLVPSPDKISNPVMKVVSRVLHFIAIDIVTAKK